MSKYTSKDVAGVLNAAREKMNDRGRHWTKRAFSRRKGNEWSYCSIGAINATTRSNELRSRAYAALMSVVGTDIVSWNDNADRKWGDVSKAFRQAARLAEKGKA